MAYLGLKKLVIAKCTEEADGLRYSEGRRLEQAIETEVNPVYKEVHDYADMNELEFEREFAYADVRLKNGTLSEEDEAVLYGRGKKDQAEGSAIISKDTDRSNYVGIGFQSREKIKGMYRYVAFWICKAKMYEASQTYATRTETIEYKTSEHEGRAIPGPDGEWKERMIFETQKQADAWLEEKAGIEKER